MLRTSFFFFVLLATMLSKAQTIELSKPVQAVQLDEAGNVYLSLSNELRKYSQQGEYLSSFSKHGTSPTLINVDNPLKIFVFFRESNQGFWLDHQLIETSSLNNQQLWNDYDVEAISPAKQGGLWLFDQFSSSLIHLNLQGEISSQSDNLSDHFSAEQPLQIIDKGLDVFILVKGESILQFSSFGTYRKKLPLKWEKLIAANKEFIYGLKGNTLVSYNLHSYSENVVHQFPSPPLAVNFHNRKAAFIELLKGKTLVKIIGF